MSEDCCITIYQRFMKFYEPTFNLKMWGGNPGSSRELKNSVEYLIMSSWLITVSTNLKENNCLGMQFWIVAFIFDIYVFRCQYGSFAQPICNTCLNVLCIWQLGDIILNTTTLYSLSINNTCLLTCQCIIVNFCIHWKWWIRS